MKKLIVLLLLFSVVLTGWAQKKASKKKEPEKAGANAKTKAKTKTNKAEQEESAPEVDPDKILGSEIVIWSDRLDVTVNSPSPELLPVLSRDGKTLYFSRKNNLENKFGIKDVEDIWYSTLKDGKGGKEAVILGNDYKPEGNKKAPLSMAHSEGKDRWAKLEHIRIAGIKGFSEKTDCFMKPDRR